MKIRETFVTNSSSSSFIIAYRKTPMFDEDTMLKYPWLKSYGEMLENTLLIEGDYSDTTKGVIIENENELETEFINRYGWHGDKTVKDVIRHDDEGLYELYNSMISHINNGFKILFKNIDNCDDAYEQVLRVLADDNDNVIMLCDC